MIHANDLSPTDTELIRSLRRQKLTIRQIAAQTGWSVGTVHAHLHGVRQVRVGGKATVVREGGAAVQKPAYDPVAAEKERVVRESKNREIQTAVKEVAFRDTVLAAAEAAAAALEAPPPYRPRKAVKGEVVESMLLHLSDWHLDEVVRAANVFGLNEYNRVRADARADRIVRATVDIKTRLETGGYRIPTLVVACNGDMVSGTIHEIERHTDGANIMTTAIRCGRLLGAKLRDLSAHFERVFVFGTSGNHGRLADAKKVQSKEPSRSWDYLVYQIARECLRDCPAVQFEIPDAWAVLYELEGKLFYQGHGHFVKSWNSIPFYGISRMTSRLGAVLAKYYRPIDYWLFGHFHVHGSIENAGGEYLINPPLIGPQEFGVHTFGDAVPPGQFLCGVHAKHGITHRWRLAAETDWPPKNRQLGVKKVRSR